MMFVSIHASPLVQVVVQLFGSGTHYKTLSDGFLGHWLTQITYSAKVKNALLRHIDN